MNRLLGLGLVVAMALVLSIQPRAAVADDAAKTISGKVSCGGCDGVAKGCCVMLTAQDGTRWILRGPAAQKVFNDRHSGKAYTATYAGDPAAKQGKDGKEYKEVTATEVKAAG